MFLDFVPEPPPGSPEEIPEYVYRQMLELADVLTETQLVSLTATHEAPSKASDGDIRLADGSDWNPGSGAGFYGYHSGAWNKLG